MGLLNPDAEGWVETAELRDFLAYLGAKPESQIVKQLIRLGIESPEVKQEGKTNLIAFTDSFLDHGSSSGILNNPQGFSAARLDHLKSFSRDGKTLTLRELAKAANDFHSRPAKFSALTGTLIQSVELSTILELYGRKKNSGEMYFLLEDLDAIWKEGRFPDQWRAPEKPYYGTVKTLWNFIRTLFLRIR